MARGVAIPDIREQLFQAAERVLEREGATGLTGRAVTREAGCATGLLYSHFGDFDAFLDELALDRFRKAAQATAELAQRAGQGTVADNLNAGALALFQSNTLALASLVTRPATRAKRQARKTTRPSQHHNPTGGLGLHRGFAEYLNAEKQLGRIAPDTDTDALATAIVATIHHLLLTQAGDHEHATRQLKRVTTTLAAAAMRANQADE